MSFPAIFEMLRFILNYILVMQMGSCMVDFIFIKIKNYVEGCFEDKLINMYVVIR